MADDIINEGQTSIVQAAFFDEDDDPVTPDSARYRIDCNVNGTATAIVAPTDLTGLSTTKDILITAAQNAMLNAALALELHILTVDFVYNTSRHGVAQYRFNVRNLRYAPVG